MNLLQNLTTDPIQQQTIVLPNGQSFIYTMNFYSMQRGWFFSNITYGSIFAINGVRICNLPNILYQWSNLIPFGIACFSPSGREPSLQQDFASGASNLYILSPAEVAAYVAYVRGGPLPP